MNVYLCVMDNGYCHCVFDTILAAQRWCEKHPQYHVIVRRLYHSSGEID